MGLQNKLPGVTRGPVVSVPFSVSPGALPGFGLRMGPKPPVASVEGAPLLPVSTRFDSLGEPVDKSVSVCGVQTGLDYLGHWVGAQALEVLLQVRRSLHCCCQGYQFHCLTLW